MIRTILDRQLHDITVQVIALGNVVYQTLDQALLVVKENDQALCERIIASDEHSDALRAEIVQKTFRSLTLHQPLAGNDLRFLCSVPFIAGSLERIGDNAAGIAKLRLRMAALEGKERNNAGRETPTDGDSKSSVSHTVTETTIIEEILSLGKEARRALQATTNAFLIKDTQAARSIWQEDDVVDVCYHLVRHEIMSLLLGMHAIPALEQDALVLQRVTYWLWIAHNLERIGDHCTNICERLVFIMERDATITPQQE